MKRFYFFEGSIVDIHRNGKPANVDDIVFQLGIKGIVVDKDDYQDIDKLLMLMRKKKLEEKIGDFFIKNNLLSTKIEGVGIFVAPLSDVYDGETVQHPEGEGIVVPTPEENYKISIISGLYDLVSL